MADDAHLLRLYIENRSEAAFGELVQRHLGLVYHAAARQLGDEAHLAGDVAQAVFLLLAERSRGLLGHPSLAGWLHVTTRFKVAEVRRAEQRRRARETVALVMNALAQDEGRTEWEQLRPILDDVLAELNADDREAVLLRFFENRAYGEIATRLRVTEGAVQKRVERALEKLRERLARRGVKSTAAALATVLTGQAALAAPGGLASAVTGAVMASGLPAVLATAGVISIMSTKTTMAVAAVALLVTGGIATHQVRAEREARTALAVVEQENTALAAKRNADAEARRVAAQASAKANSVNAAPARPAVASNAGGGLASVEESRALLRANPELRAAFADYLAVTIEDEYEDLIAELGLTADQKTRFLEVLALGRTRIVGNHQLTLREREFSPGEYGQMLREVLGEQGYQRYRNHGASAMPRGLAREVTRLTYYSPTPLTGAQAADLRRITAAALADPSLGPKHTGNVWPYLPMPVWDRILSDASSVLPESQVDALRSLQRQSRFWHAQVEAGKAYREKQKAGTP